jgi:heme-degrading monooxygenase HmoA
MVWSTLQVKGKMPVLVSVTRLRVRSLQNLPGFLWVTFLGRRQTVRAPGFFGGRLLLDRRRTFWTLTTWEDEKAMRTFRGSDPHAQAMPKLVEWCDEAAYAHWTAADGSIPDWPEAYDRLVSEGRLSRVAQPSPFHLSRHFPKPRLKPLIGQDIKPVAK